MNTLRSIRISRWQALLGAVCLVGLAASLYGIYGFNGTDEGKTPAISHQQEGLDGQRGHAAHAGIDGKLATGALAAFLFKDQRPPVADISFRDSQGQAVSLSDWRGRVVLLNLWATWCGPCRREMPELARLQESMGSADFEVVALSVDRKGAEASRKFLTEAGSTALKLYVDKTSDALGKLNALGLPATVLIDRDGNEIGRLLGPAEWASPEAVRLIKTALAENKKQS